MLSETEKSIYKRQMMIEGWGEPAQERLKASTVFIAGAGGLGSPVAMYLTAAGVGRLRICDFDSPELSNLNRQILHNPSRIGTNKAISARQTLQAMSSVVEVTALPEKITPDTVDRLVGDAALIVDCMDNFETRFVLNACALRRRIPLVYGSIRGMEGRLGVFQPGKTACLQCLVSEAPPKEVFPVVGAVPGVIGTLEALEVLKVLTGVGTPLWGMLLVWDGELQEFQKLRVSRDPACPVCSA